MDKYIKIKTLFEKNADEDRAESMAHYMRDQFCFYGLSSPKRKTLYKDFLKEEKKRRTIDWELLDRCYADMHREFQYFVCDYLSAMKQYLIYEDIQHIKEYVKSRQWWDTIDCFDRIIGSIGLRDHRVDDLMLEWSVDEDFWLRRLAIDHQLLRKEKTIQRFLKRYWSIIWAVLNSLSIRQPAGHYGIIPKQILYGSWDLSTVIKNKCLH